MIRQLQVLTDGRSFSTSAEVASLIRSTRRGAIVGEETSGGYYGNNSGLGVPLVLPHAQTRLEIPLSAYYLNAVPDLPRGAVVAPDVPVEAVWHDVAGGMDRAMDVALKLANTSAGGR